MPNGIIEIQLSGLLEGVNGFFDVAYRSDD
jgi:hypothetical protein